MKEESSRDLFLDRPGYALTMIIGLLFVLIVSLNRLLVRYAIIRVNVSPEAQNFIDTLLTAKIVSQIYSYIIIDGMLVGLLIRSILRLVEPERPLGILASMGISYLSALFMFLIAEMPSLAILLILRIHVDLSGISTAEDFSKSLDKAFDSRSSMHPIASKLIVAFHYLSIALFLATIRYLVYRKYSYRTATIVDTLIFTFFLMALI